MHNFYILLRNTWANRKCIFTFHKFANTLFNFMTYLLLIAAIQVVAQKWWISNIIFSAVLFIFSIVNYFVITYHGMPLSYQELANAKTAMNVVGNYSFSFTKRISAIIICFLLSILFSLLFFLAIKGGKINLFLSFLNFFFLVFTSNK